MDFEYSDKTKDMIARVRAFMDKHVYPNVERFDRELNEGGDRWKVVPLLQEGVPYREIHDRTLVSVTTIGRVARTLEHGAGGYAKAARGTRRLSASH